MATTLTSEMMSLPAEPLKRKSPTSIDALETMQYHSQKQSQQQEERDSLHQLNNNHQPFKQHYRRLLSNFQKSGSANDYNGNKRPLSDDYDNLQKAMPRLSLVLEERPSELDLRSVSEAGDDIVDESDFHSSLSESPNASLDLIVSCDDNANDIKRSLNGDFVTAHGDDSSAGDVSVSTIGASSLRGADAERVSELRSDKSPDSLSTQPATTACAGSDGEVYVPSFSHSKELSPAPEIGSGNFGIQISASVNGQSIGDGVTGTIQSVGKPVFPEACGSSGIEETLIRDSGLNPTSPLESTCDRLVSKELCCVQSYNESSRGDDNKLEKVHEGPCYSVSETPATLSGDDELKSDTNTDKLSIDNNPCDRECVDNSPVEHCADTRIAHNTQAYPEDMGLSSSRQSKARGDADKGTALKEISKPIVKNGVKKENQKEGGSVKGDNSKKKTTSFYNYSSPRVNKTSNGHPPHVVSTPSCASLQLGVKDTHSRGGQGSGVKGLATSRGQGGTEDESEKPLLGSTSHTTRGRRSAYRRTIPSASEIENGIGLTDASKDHNIPVSEDNTETVTITSPSVRATTGSIPSSPGYADIASFKEESPSDSKSDGKTGGKKNVNELVVIYSKPIPRQFRNNDNAVKYVDSARAIQANSKTSHPPSCKHGVNGVVPNSVTSTTVSASLPPLPPPLYSSLCTATSTAQSHSSISSSVFKDERRKSTETPQANGEHSITPTNIRAEPSEEPSAVLGDYDNPVVRSQESERSQGPRSIDDLQAALSAEYSISRYPYADRERYPGVSISSSEAGDPFSPIDGAHDSKRNSSSSSLFSSIPGDSPDSISTDSQFHPAREYPYSSDNDTEVRSSDGRYRPSSRVQVTCQIKKSSTSDALDFVGRGSNFPRFPRASSASYDYYSLDRRSRHRFKSIQDSHDRTVSMDQLLKIRKQSWGSIVSRPDSTPLEDLSVDDILRTCSEYEEDEILNRHRLSSQNSRKSSISQMSFIEAINTPLSQNDETEAGHRASHTSLVAQVNPKTKTQMKNDSTDLKIDQGQSNKPVCPQQMTSMDNKIGSSKGPSPVTKTAPSSGPPARVFSVSGIRVVPLDPSAKTKADMMKSRSFDSNHWPPVTDNAFPSRAEVFFPHSHSQPSLKGASPTTAFKTPPSSHSQGPCSPGLKHFSYSPKGELSSSLWHNNNPRLDTIISVEEDESIIKEGATTPTPKTTSPSLTSHSSYHSDARNIPSKPHLKGSCMIGNRSNDDNDFKDNATLTSSLQPSNMALSSDGVTDNHDVTDGQCLGVSRENMPFPRQDISTQSSSESNNNNIIITSATNIPSTASSVTSPPSSSSTPVSFSMSTSTSVSSISSTVTSVSMDTRGSRPIVSLPLLVSGPSMTTIIVDTLSSPTDTSPTQASSPVPRSPNTIAKLEAVEAIQWLRAAGFPQYAQMFEDGLFPIELALVEKDHDFLDKDSIQSLFRRLETLNKYAGMKLDAHQRKKAASEEEEDDDICALSERWQYQKSVRRWSRKDLGLSSKATESGDSGDLTRGGSHDSLLADQDSGSQTGDSPLLESKMPHQDTQVLDGANQKSAAVIAPGEPLMQTGNNPISPKLRRVASERIKTAKSLWKKMEGGLRSKKSRRHPNQRNILEISGPVVADQENMQAKLERLNCVDISPTSPGPGGGRGSESGAPNAPIFPSPAPLSPTSPHIPNTPPSALQPHSPAQTGHETQQRVVAPSSPTPPSPLLATAAFRSRHSHGSQSLRVKPTYVKDDSSDTNNHANASATSSSMDSTTLREYYNAQSQLLQTLESSGPARKISGNDPGLVEIFVLPQDHQPGMFPRVLQNGYIEADLSGTALNPRTGSIRLGRDLSKSPDQPSANSTSSGSAGHSKRLGNRVSMYDNFAPATDMEKGTNGANKPASVLAGVDEDASSTTTTTTLASTGGVYQSQESKDRSVSFDSARSGQEQEDFTRRHSYRELRDRILSEASTPSLTLRSKQESFDSAQNEPIKDAQLTSPSSRGFKQSVSVDSYLKDTGSDVIVSHSRKSSSGSSSGSHGNRHANTSLSEQFSEFDVILQQLFDNISDLTRCMGRDETESSVQYTPKSSSQEVRLSDATVSSITTTSSLSSSSSATAPSSSSISLTVTTTSVSFTSSTTILSTSSSKDTTQTHPGSQVLSGLVIPASSTTSEKSAVLDQSQNPDPDILASPNSDCVFSPSSPLSPTSVDKSLDQDHENSSSGGGDSHTGESISDQEGGLGDFSHDDSLEQIPAVARERRDSGVGHSLTRAPSDRRRKKIRWHSFQKCHRPDVGTRNMQINSLTVSQMVWLRKLSLLKLTGIMERCLPVNKSGWNWVVPKFMKKHKTPDFSDKNVFGVPLSVMVQRTGQPLPQCVLYAMRYLRRTSQNAVGIFRRSGVKSKIQHLIDRLEANPDFTDFEDMNAYNVADMLKTFFRELPECLLTNKLSETFRNIYTHVPPGQRLEAIQAAILILPDENREVLQSLLLFLSDISIHEADHQMNAVNLAVCFTPTVFMLGARQNTLSHSPKRHRKNAQGLPGVPDPREIMEQKTSQDCLLLMITECKKLFTVPPNLFRQVQTQSLINMEPPQMFDLCGEDANVNDEVRAFGQERVQMVLKEAHDKNRGWIPAMNISHIDVSHRKSMDDYPLREWKLVVDIDAPPIEVLRRIMHERHTWDEDLLSWSVVERINPHADIFQFVLNSMAPHPCRHFCVLRYWRSDLQKGACALVTMSVEHTDAMEVQGVRAIDLGSFFLMEPCGSGRSRLTHVIRVDTRGRRPEWYTKVFGHVSASFLERLRDSFKQDTSGPETKV